MATKTFEELKQLAIQIRDEKTNKQNTATRVGTAMLEHINKLEQDYYDKTKTDEKFTELEKRNEIRNESLSNDIDLRDESLFTNDGVFIGLDGSLLENKDCKSTEYIDVSEGQSIYYKGFINEEGICVAGYNNTNFVRAILAHGSYSINQKIIIPSGINRIRSCSAFIRGYEKGSLTNYRTPINQLYKNRGWFATLESGGYAYFDGNSFNFSKLIIRNLYNGKYYKLADGINSYNKANVINADSLGDNLFVYLNDLDKDSNTEISIYCDKYLYGNDILSLGCFPGLQVVSGGILNDLIHNIKSDNNTKILNSEESLYTNFNGYIALDGSIIENEDCRYTDYIDVQEGDVFYYMGYINSDGICIAGYNNTEFVSSLLGHGDYKVNKIVVIPSGVNKIRSCSAFINGYTKGSLTKEGDNLYKVICSNFTFSRLINLKKKKVLFFGDSFTEMGYYAEIFAQLTGCEVYIRGAGGTTYAIIDKSLLWNKSLCERVDMPSNNTIGNVTDGVGLPDYIDYAFVFAGINDWGRVDKTNCDTTNSDASDGQTNTHELFGSIENENKDEFCGAVRYVLRRMKEKYPNAKIYSILPTHVYSPDNYPSWNDYNLSTKNDLSSTITEQKTTEGKSLDDYRYAIKTISSILGIKVIDTTKIGISPMTNIDKYIEGLHPNMNGASYITIEILNQM